MRVDAAGNILGRREGREPGLPVILVGSHVDSVPRGGNYDGDVGVIGAIECVELLKSRGIVTRHLLEVVVFANEEGGLIGSRAMIGELTPKALGEASQSGVTHRDGIVALGGNPDRLDAARRRGGELRAFLELHIEQGANLDAAGVDIGVVEGIVGIH